MLEAIRQNTRILTYIIVPLIMGSFVFVGAVDYLRDGAAGGETVAEVNGKKITRDEWNAHFRDSMERFRQQAPTVDLRMLETPAMKLSALDDLVRKQVYVAAAKDGLFAATDARVSNYYRHAEEFAPFRDASGKIDSDKLKAQLAQQGMSVPQMEAQLREIIALRQVQDVMVASVVPSKSAAVRAFDAQNQRREVQTLRFAPADFSSKVTPTDADVEAFYKDPKNSQLYLTTEQADIEYLNLDIESVSKNVLVTDSEVQDYYHKNAERFTEPETRRIRHILVKVDQSASDKVRQEAKARADALHAELLKAPDSFADVARKSSEDAESAANGGDLDVFLGRQDVDATFSAAIFALKLNEISPVVPTPEGYYIAQLRETKGGQKASFDSVRADLTTEVRRHKAQAAFSSLVGEVTRLAFDEPDSLKPIAEKLKLELLTAKAITRQAAPGAGPVLGNSRFIESVFSEDSVTNKLNTKAIEIKPNHIAFARVVEYRPATQRPLEQVRDDVRQRVTLVQAAELARKEGQAKFEAAKAAAGTALSSPVLTISRSQPADVPGELIEEIMRTPESILPTVVSVDLGDRGYAFARVTKMVPRENSEAEINEATLRYGRTWGKAEADAQYEAWRTRYKAKIVPDLKPD